MPRIYDHTVLTNERMRLAKAMIRSIFASAIGFYPSVNAIEVIGYNDDLKSVRFKIGEIYYNYVEDFKSGSTISYVDLDGKNKLSLIC